MIDRSSLNVVSLVLGSAGLLTALTGFNVPALRHSFWGENPYQLKRDEIQAIMGWLFGGLAVVALLLQLVAEVAGSALPDRLFTTGSYVRVAIGGTVATTGLVWLMTKGGRRLAAGRWRPMLVERYREMLQRDALALENGGLYPEHLAERHRYTVEQEADARSRTLNEVDQHIALIEDLFELPPLDGRAARVQRLAEVFDGTSRAA